MARRRRRTLAQAALALAGSTLLALCACRATPGSSTEPAASAETLPPGEPVAAAAPATSATASAASAPPSAVERLPSIDAPSGFVTLAVPAFREAIVSVPLDTSEPRAIALALHGNYDRPEWQCQVWRRITRGSVWVLCPRGIPRRDVPASEDRWEWGSLAKTKQELVAAVSALRERFGPHVDAGPMIFTGFSLGAILGARLIQDPELDFGAAVLIEGGYQGWTAGKAKALQPRLRRLLFGCGQSECRNAFKYQLGPLFERSGLSASMVADVKAGHTYDDPVASLVAAEWSGLLATLKHE
jgi:predicted esterase